MFVVKHSQTLIIVMNMIIGGNPCFAAEFDFVTDAFPSRESKSVFVETSYSFSDTFRLISGLRYSDDTFETDVTNFFLIILLQKAVETK